MIAKIVDDKSIRVLDLSQFDIEAILHSGQVFRYFRIENGWRVICGTNYADIFSGKDSAEIRTSNPKFFFSYFDFEKNYASITPSFGCHPLLIPIWESGRGIRILRGEFIETVISFILSANNNIKRFTKTLNLLCVKYGQKLDCGEFGFPSLQSLARLSEKDFAELGCGYRSAYLVKTVQKLSSPEFDFDVLDQLPTAQLNKALRELQGVGDKVARCIMLFCFHRLSVAPVDTWMEKACREIFNISETEKKSSKKMAEKFEAYFGQYAGIAQQKIFYYLQHLRMSLK